MATRPTYRSVLIVDVERSGERSDPEKAAMRSTLYRLLMVAFARSEIMWDECRLEDRGDGAYVLVPPTVTKLKLAIDLIDSLNRLVRDDGDGRDATPSPSVPRARLRLRVALHAGEVTLDAHGSSGSDVDLAFAMVDSDDLRSALRNTRRGTLALVMSEAFYRATARHHYAGLDPSSFVQIEINTKHEPVRAWMRVMD